MKAHTSSKQTFGLAHWMNQVPGLTEKAASGFGSKAVHDLRVVLRRCRSLAEGFRALDHDKNWKKMRRQATDLFDSLGALRDAHVMLEWVEKLGSPDDQLARRLAEHLDQQEKKVREQAEDAIQHFDISQWSIWIRLLPPRTHRMTPGSEVFQALALEKWHAARRLQGPALRTHSADGFHRLRIGLKKFRYVVENFLPQHHEAWQDGLKHAQDLLGEIHDLDVLHKTLEQFRSDTPQEQLQQWEQKLDNERLVRIERYAKTMAGEGSLWLVWRSSLPRGMAARHASLSRLDAWSSSLESDMQHSRRVARFAVQIYDGLNRIGVLAAHDSRSAELLRAAAVVHEVGRASGSKNHHKKTEKMVGQIDQLAGWSRQDILTIARVARYHRGALPRTSTLQGLSSLEQRKFKLLAGILRLANAFDAEHDGTIRRITITRNNNGFVLIRARGLVQYSESAEHIAGARYLLETACGIPIVVLPFVRQKRKQLMDN